MPIYWEENWARVKYNVHYGIHNVELTDTFVVIMSLV